MTMITDPRPRHTAGLNYLRTLAGCDNANGLHLLFSNVRLSTKPQGGELYLDLTPFEEMEAFFSVEISNDPNNPGDGCYVSTNWKHSINEMEARLQKFRPAWCNADPGEGAWQGICPITTQSDDGAWIAHEEEFYHTYRVPTPATTTPQFQTLYALLLTMKHWGWEQYEDCFGEPMGTPLVKAPTLQQAQASTQL